MEDQPPPYPNDPSAAYHPGPPQPTADVKPDVDAYGQPVGGYIPPQTAASGYPPPQGGYAAQQQPQTTVVIAQQPAVVTQVNPGIKPSNYLVLSIINLLFCWFLLGIIALIFSLQVDSAWNSGRYDEARRNANIAKILNIIGIIVGISGWVGVGIYVIIRIVAVATIAASGVTG